jgi:hypothetical protein
MPQPFLHGAVPELTVTAAERFKNDQSTRFHIDALHYVE